MPDIDVIRRDFSDYLAANAHVEIKPAKVPEAEEGSQHYFLSSPWEDSTVGILVPNDDSERSKLVDTLLSITLPKKLSAIRHTDGKLEIIWTANKLRDIHVEVGDREFIFSHNGVDRECKFGSASDELIQLAKHCRPVSNPTKTGHRNIMSLQFHARNLDIEGLDKPISFFVDCVGLEDTDVIDLCHHLNAYMLYYDKSTPTILVHQEEPNTSVVRTRYTDENFPKRINSKKIDPTVLSFWNGVFGNQDPTMKFLLLYRLVEYLAFSHLEAKTMAEMKRLLSRPNLLDRVDISAKEAVGIMASKGAVDMIPRMLKMVEEAVDTRVLWRGIENNAAMFRNSTDFDGGLVIGGLLSGSCAYNNWEKNGIQTTLKALRDIRNALAHGQDEKTRLTILSTPANSARLAPWLNLIEIIAGECMLYVDSER